jgi:outer membrane protein
MKKYIVLIVLLVFGFTQSNAQRFAYVDIDYILDMLPDYKSAQKQLDLIAETWQKEAEEKKTEIDKMLQEFQVEQILLTAELKKKKETDIKLKEAELKEFMNKKFGYEGELFKKRQELVKPIQDKVFDACQNIAKKSALDFIFAKGGEMIMMYSNARYDKSDEVLIELGVNVTKNKGNTPDQNSNPDNSSSPRPGGLRR